MFGVPVKFFYFLGGGGIKYEFWCGVLIVRIGRYIWVTEQPQCPSGVQRLSTYTTRPEGPSLMGRTDGRDGDQKCPLMFFIFCGYIEKVYTYLYR